MNKIIKNSSPFNFKETFSRWKGLGCFSLVLLFLCILANVQIETEPKFFLAGEIASNNISADKEIRVEDQEATELKRLKVGEAQPPYFDIAPRAFDNFTAELMKILETIQGKEGEELRQAEELLEGLDTEVNSNILNEWRKPEFLLLIQRQVFPQIREFYNFGIVQSLNTISPKGNGLQVQDLETGQETLILDTRAIVDIPQVLASVEDRLKKLKIPYRTRAAVAALVKPYLHPNFIFNQELTMRRKADITSAVEPIYRTIKKGEIIIRQGEPVRPEHQHILQALFTEKESIHIEYLQSLGIFTVGMLLVLGLRRYLGPGGILSIKNKDWLLVSVAVLICGLLSKATSDLSLTQAPTFGVKDNLLPYCIPAAGIAGVVSMLVPRPIGIFTGFLIAFVCSWMNQGNLGLFYFYAMGTIFFLNHIKLSESRAALLSGILSLFGILVLVVLGIALIMSYGPREIAISMLCLVINVLASLILLLGLTPLFEYLFGYTSRFKLMELMNLEQPLLRELMVSAPGTYHHSIIVSHMVEAGARAIGANALLAKVAALYHDIGKIKNPQYFIENLKGEENRHDKLTPSMSALILISHVKKGVDLAKEHRLGSSIANLIRQHHGTTLIAFFYSKAKTQAETKELEQKIREEDFRYPGPKPQTKEAGLILLADVIEASSRTLVDPTPNRLKHHVDTVIKRIFSMGELDESELTLKDLNLVSDSFLRILTGIFHTRIEYPKDEKNDSGSLKNNKPKPDKAESALPVENAKPIVQ